MGWYKEPWPEANTPPKAGDYVDRYPTRYTWEDKVDKLARYIIGKYGVWANTYYDHPPEEDAPGLFDEVSIDFWAWEGRGYALPTDKGELIWKEIFYSSWTPQIDWMIYQGYIWSQHNPVWRPWGYDDFTWHYDHIHVTFVRGTGEDPPDDDAPVPPPPPPPPGSKVLNAQMLQKCMYGLSDKDAEYYLPYLIKTFKKFHIDTRARISAFLGQIGHESGSLQFWREIGGDQKPYAPWYGRGPMQLTWYYNYDAYAKWRSYNPDVYNSPDLVASDTQVGLDAAGWFWEIHEGFDLNTLADQATWEAYDKITRIINGGYNGKVDRDNRYQAAWEAIPEGVVLGAPIVPKPDPPLDPKPDPKPDPPPPDDNMKSAWIGFTADPEQWMRTGSPVPKGSWIKFVKTEKGTYAMELELPTASGSAAPDPQPDAVVSRPGIAEEKAAPSGTPLSVDKEYESALRSIKAIQAAWKSMEDWQQQLNKVNASLSSHGMLASPPQGMPPGQAKLIQVTAHGVALGINAALIAVGFTVDEVALAAIATPLVQGAAGLLATFYNNRTKKVDT